MQRYLGEDRRDRVERVGLVRFGGADVVVLWDFGDGRRVVKAARTAGSFAAASDGGGGGGGVAPSVAHRGGHHLP